jgi:hypothetical protein
MRVVVLTAAVLAVGGVVAERVDTVAAARPTPRSAGAAVVARLRAGTKATFGASTIVSRDGRLCSSPAQPQNGLFTGIARP